jgi:hypothetical protein
MVLTPFGWTDYRFLKDINIKKQENILIFGKLERTGEEDVVA